MRVPALAEVAAQLPWLTPCAASLLAMARLPAPGAWSIVRYDPAAVLLVLRLAARKLSSPVLCFFPAVLQDPAILDGAVRLLDPQLLSRRDGTASKDAGLRTTYYGQQTTDYFVDWSRPLIQPIYRACLLYARSARRLAEMTGRSDPENAWVAGLLTPLGWLAVCAVHSEQAVACLTDPGLAQDPDATQQRHWGYEQAGIARRLLRRWGLPRWLAVIVGNLGLPVPIAQKLGADPDLFAVVQRAVGLVQRNGAGLHLNVGADPADKGTVLDFPAHEQEALYRELEHANDPFTPSELSTPPRQVPLLLELLSIAAENLRLHDAPSVDQLERERDELHRALEEQRTGEAGRLHTLKLTSLAQFAAGAAHEINNPLAVISGQAQYLLGHEFDPGRQRALQAIISQTQRIYQVLNDLMQFARPPTPQCQVVDVRDLVREVMLSLNDWAAQRRVQLVCPELDHAVHLHADPGQIRTALECLLRNAIEASPAGGWAGLRLETPAPDRLEVVVEDSGAAPMSSQRDHIFDPFYCGREAGRGRGLGLPTAWRLAREHGGDVRLDSLSAGPTRFVLSLPREPGTNGQESATKERETAPEQSSGCHLPLSSDS